MNNFNSSFDDFSKEIKKNLKILIQNIQQISTNNTKENTEKTSEITLNLENSSSEKESSYQLEINKMKELITSSEKYNSVKNKMEQGLSDTSDINKFQNIAESCEETSSFLEQLGFDSSEFSNIFTSAFEDVIEKSESFSDSMKNMLNDLKNYFVKTIAKAISDSLISKQDSDVFLSSVNSSDSYGGFGGITSILSSFLGLFVRLPSHHSGGVIPSSASYSLPGTQEYLAVLKGGERVLSPAENSAYNDYDKLGNVVVNNFNVQAWDSKDVQKYLLDNKNLLANITADNIKYNNANLRYMIGG
ncbi:MAG: hypothetical protein ACI37T_02350 [Candidatus Gastranaerophilaceae bacterium]